MIVPSGGSCMTHGVVASSRIEGVTLNTSRIAFFPFADWNVQPNVKGPTHYIDRLNDLWCYNSCGNFIVCNGLFGWTPLFLLGKRWLFGHWIIVLKLWVVSVQFGRERTIIVLPGPERLAFTRKWINLWFNAPNAKPSLVKSAIAQFWFSHVSIRLTMGMVVLRLYQMNNYYRRNK